MKQLTALVWKEWQEVCAYLWIGLGIFLALPLIGGLEALIQHGKRFEILTTPWILTFGGVLAVFVAVGVTCRDLDRRLEDFWRSRPVSITRWLLVKYVIGLAVVLIACALPLAVELQLNREPEAKPLIAWYPFFWTALYSMGFLVGCLVRRSAHAGMLALAAMLLLYFLPAIIPPLAFLNSQSIIDNWRPNPAAANAGFAAGMLAISAISLCFALLTVKKDWQIDSGRRMMYGSISAAILILFSSASFQLGTNLPILQTVDLPEGEIARLAHYENGQGFVATCKFVPAPTPTEQYAQYAGRQEFRLRSLDLTPSGIRLGNPILTDPRFTYGSIFWNPSAPNHPEIRYEIDADTDSLDNTPRVLNWKINVYRFDKGTVEAAVNFSVPYDPNTDYWPKLFAWNDRLYAISSHLLTFDISDPFKPRLISTTPFQNVEPQDPPDADQFTMALPQIPGLPARQRLEAARWMQQWWRGGYEGDLFCKIRYESIAAYRITKLTDEAVTFAKIAQYEPTLLEKIFGSYSYGDMRLKGGLLYVSQVGGQSVFNPHVSVFDVKGAHALHLIAHFAAPGVGPVCPLPDGRAIIGGSKIWLVGPPPSRTLN